MLHLVSFIAMTTIDPKNQVAENRKGTHMQQ